MSRLSGMFERRRAPARQGWLLLRPPVQDDGAWQWRRLPGAEGGDWPPPAHHQDEQVALIIPAALCSHFQVQAPPGLKPHEWPLLLEDQLQQPADEVQVSCLSRSPGHLELLVVDRAQVQRWLSTCDDIGLAPTCLLADMQLLPQVSAGQVLRWSRETDSCLLRADALGAQQWLVWPHLLGDVPDSWQPTTDEMSGPWPSQWATLDRLPNLLAGTGARRSRPRLTSRLFTATQKRLMAVCALLVLCWGALAAVQFWQQIPAWKAQVERVTGPVSTPQQAARLLARLQAQQTDWRSRQLQVAELEGAVSRWLAGQQGWGVSGNYFDGRNWRVVLNGNVAAPALGHWQSIAKAAGAVASVESDEKKALLTVSFDLGVQP
jgi:general secretion pathway protein L